MRIGLVRVCIEVRETNHVRVSRNLPSIGALLTNLSLGMDTFPQQLLAVEYRNVMDTSQELVAHIQRTEIYDNWASGALHVVSSPLPSFNPL